LIKDGAVIINTARGGLIDNEALIEAIENGKLAGAALDVVEGETGIYYNNRKAAILKQREMAILNAFPNVIMSPHMAFLTDDSNRDMVYHSMESCVDFLQNKENPWEIQ
jgi:lactate dehydrogenase-like 2-hydroxyacid dehydrogenase